MAYVDWSGLCAYDDIGCTGNDVACNDDIGLIGNGMAYHDDIGSTQATEIGGSHYQHNM